MVPTLKEEDAVMTHIMRTRTARGVAAVAGALALSLTAVACGGDEADSPDDTAEPAADDSPDDGAAAGGDYEVAFVQGVAGDEFYITMQCGIEAAADELGVTVTTQGPQEFDPTLQSPIVDSVVASAPDAMLIAPTDVTAMRRPIQAAIDAGIEVVLVDTTLEDTSGTVARVASDNVGGGAAAFQAIEEAVPDGGKVLVISTEPGVSSVDARVQGFEEAVAENPAFEYLGVQYSQNQPARAAEIITSALQADPDIVGVFATNLFSAEGAATGIRQAGAEGITVVGFDAGPAQVEALRDGTVQALIAQQPATIGEEGLAQALAQLNGEPVEEDIQTGFTILTADNIDTPEGEEAAYRSTC
jgi:ribose transport system substrate-binding protein